MSAKWPHTCLNSLKMFNIFNKLRETTNKWPFSPLPFPVSAVLELDEVRGQLVGGLDGLYPLVAHHRLRPRVILHELFLDLHTKMTNYFVISKGAQNVWPKSIS